MRKPFTPSAAVRIAARLDEFMRSVEPRLAKDFRCYASAASRLQRFPGEAKAPEYHQPYWLLLAQWLVNTWQGPGKEPLFDRRTVEDILWGQYCLFLCVKIHDDIFDAHTHRSSLIYAGDLFLVEAHEVFLRYFDSSSPFWKFFHSSIAETLRTIFAIDQFQCDGSTHSPQSLKLFAKEYAICKIAAYALCLKAGRKDEFPRIARFADEMAIVGQAIDDLQDIEVDYERGRINFAASFLLRFGNNGQQLGSRTLERIGENLLRTDASTRFFLELQRHVDAASKSMEPLQIPDATWFLGSYTKHLKRMEDRFHRQRVKQIFGRFSHFKKSIGARTPSSTIRSGRGLAHREKIGSRIL
jgi:hypothetical protein